MKKILCILMLLVFIGCSSEQSVVPQKVIIEVVSATDSEVAVKDEKPVKTMAVENPEGRLSGLSFITKDKAFIKIFSGLSVSDVTRLWNDLVILEENTDIRDVNLYINSPGGDAFAGLALADQIERATKKGFTMTAHASGIIASAAVPVFAVCKPRYAAPGTIFMVHEAALWKWPGRETASMIRSQNELMNLLQERYIDKLVKNSNLSKTDWECLEKETTWFNTDKAVEWGLVDSVE